ncbi:MAG: hypothetical protein GY708_17155 [Actinomycetia bacterium]|nr:hypothetical protein [Actinomycetes bacterium]MCP4962934.1 hypothetical protein [Actinomycetes bacterium]
MTPTLAGRIQTRLLLLSTIGLAWVVLVAALLGGSASPSYTDRLRAGVAALIITMLLGVVWELVYHAAQQYRWEKDWPTGLALAVGLTEGTAVWFALNTAARRSTLVPSMTVPMFVVVFGTTWLLIWLFASGPMRVVALRWRYRGGRLL